ncbi:MAG: tyrosine-type recombinase/integrase [Pirellulales bacterium]|jgi:site-specific recombinase XerD|nr:tyrosine-type recombinase/integrase [Pirellulales bacterium]HJN66479.1 tyrosine-type recombinase/integrase [Pirellulales bacterium]
MTTLTKRFRPGTYNSGQPYAPARGRYAPRLQLENRLAPCHAVIDLPSEQPEVARFIDAIKREMKIRCYQRKTIKTYKNALRLLLRWFGGPPHQITREDVRVYLETLVDGGASSSWIGINLSAIRTGFDKMCGQGITLGLESPRRPKRLPVVLSGREIIRLLQAAPSLRDKLLLGIMYATAMRVSEVCQLRNRDIDFDRRRIRVWQGKGRTDRQVLLPESLEGILRELCGSGSGDDFIFPGDRRGRYLSPRTARRAMQRALKMAGIRKRASCHSLRHSSATHMVENGTNIRCIQTLLGHVRLETTRLYTHVAGLSERQVRSPLDVLTMNGEQRSLVQPVGRMRLQLSKTADPCSAAVELTILTDTRHVTLGGITVREARPGWVTLELPPSERWEEPLRWLTRQEHDRVESPEFYALLQRHATARYLAWRDP